MKLGVRCAGWLVCIGAVACTADRGSEETRSASRAAVVSASEDATGVRLPWSTGAEASGVGLRPAVRERAALGAPAIAVGPSGEVFVLDAVNGRVARVVRGEAILLAKVPEDANDLAVGPDGAFAVRRSVRPEVLVFDPHGELVGRVDTSAVHGESIALGLSRRVFVTTPYQETFGIGSPSLPQLAEAIVAGKREGAAFLADGSGVVAVRRHDRELELRVSSARGGTVVHSLGSGDAARIVGASGTVVCARIEHVKQDANGPANSDEGGALHVAREAACVDVATGRTALRVSLPAPGTYVPRRELAFAGDTLAFAHPTPEGLVITTWTVAGGPR